MVDLGDAASLVLKSPQKAINSVVNLAEYVQLRRQNSRALKHVVGCVVKNIEDRRDLTGAIERFAEETDERNWRSVVDKTKIAKQNIDSYIKNLPTVAPVIVRAHFGVFDKVEEFFCTQRNIFSQIIENGNKCQVDLEDAANGLEFCRRVIEKSENKNFGGSFDILEAIERVGQTSSNIQILTKLRRVLTLAVLKTRCRAIQRVIFHHF